MQGNHSGKDGDCDDSISKEKASKLNPEKIINPCPNSITAWPDWLREKY
jgi:hypothetical protein